MCKELQLHAVEVELDARVVSDLMNHNGGSNEVNSSFVADYRLLISQMLQVKVNHCYREANHSADGLARLGTKHDDDILYYNSPPPTILNIFLSDMYGHEFVRLCPATNGSGSPFYLNEIIQFTKKKIIIIIFVLCMVGNRTYVHMQNLDLK